MHQHVISDASLVDGFTTFLNKYICLSFLFAAEADSLANAKNLKIAWTRSAETS